MEKKIRIAKTPDRNYLRAEKRWHKGMKQQVARHNLMSHFGGKTYRRVTESGRYRVVSYPGLCS
jgi:hypothetical protein